MRVTSLVFCISVGTAASADMSFDWPVDCTQGVDCYIQQFVDRDPGPGWQDFTCGPLSYDGHKGTDIAVATLKDMQAGVAVLAAAPGLVIGKRDGMPDQYFEAGTDLQGRECGNGVVVQHENGWVTQYCHLRQGSVLVGRGARVDAGQALGEIGLSGRTQFPHLDFSIRRNNAVVDPFAPDQDLETCQQASGHSTLWSQDVSYVPGGLLDVGFTVAVPEFDTVKAGRADLSLERDMPIVLFAFAYGAREGDQLIMRIDGPAGQIIENEVDITRNRAQFFRAGGRKAPASGWPPGRYRGVVELRRDGEALSVLSTDATLDESR